MTIQQLKKFHAKIMAMIIKSDSKSATVSFRTFGKCGYREEKDFLLDFFDISWYEYNGGNQPSVYLQSTEKEGMDYVELVGRFLNRPKQQPEAAENERLQEALQGLYDEQNGAPLARREDDWFQAYKNVGDALQKLSAAIEAAEKPA